MIVPRNPTTIQAQRAPMPRATDRKKAGLRPVRKNDGYMEPCFHDPNRPAIRNQRRIAGLLHTGGTSGAAMGDCILPQKAASGQPVKFSGFSIFSGLRLCNVL